MTGIFAGRAPFFAIVIHRGRKSGKTYRTPINAFPTADGFVIAFTYGPDTDWSQNVLAAGGCQLEYRGKVYALTDPRVASFKDEQQQFPALASAALRLFQVDKVLMLSSVG
ncbi:MAG: nitroreductase family deazaflavin-dependent oxidoreductase [Thermomicrobiales bacterium]